MLSSLDLFSQEICNWLWEPFYSLDLICSLLRAGHWATHRVLEDPASPVVLQNRPAPNAIYLFYFSFRLLTLLIPTVGSEGSSHTTGSRTNSSEAEVHLRDPTRIRDWAHTRLANLARLDPYPFVEANRLRNHNINKNAIPFTANKPNSRPRLSSVVRAVTQGQGEGVAPSIRGKQEERGRHPRARYTRREA